MGLCGIYGQYQANYVAIVSMCAYVCVSKLVSEDGTDLYVLCD